MKLEGLRVIDLSLYLPGPHMTMMMADHGAEVIKVEPPGEGEPNRHIGALEDGISIFFRNTHRGKRSVTLDLKDPAAREALLELAATADVFVEAFRPGVVDRLGVGYRDVAARNPRIVYCSITAYGQTGPYRDRPAHDLATEAMAGVVSLNLGNDGEPANPHVPVADLAASMLALSGVLMALLRRGSTGLGDYLDISMHDAALSCTPNITGEVFAHQRAPVVKEQRSLGGSAFYRIYRTQDGRHIVLGGQEPKFIRTLLGELGRPEFIALCERGPGAHQAPVIEFLRGVFAARTQADWIEWFRGKDICFAPVKNLREAFDDPHAQARGMRLVDESGHEHIGLPIRFAHEPGRADLTLPAQGEHTALYFPQLPAGR
ncbi:MAG: Acetyl-CoA:oxalate CoA-transferase [Steroidobacteraceae bacterium]|nr:Acetyl-CoA:oxalate CoA-transferase [Steroidobacteraceae bacterium]